LAAAPGISGDSAAISPGLGAVAAPVSDQVDCLPDRLGAARCLTRSVTARAVDGPARAFSTETGMNEPFTTSRIQDTLAFRAEWASGMSAYLIGLKYGVQGRSVTRRAMLFGYPRRGRDHQILGPMPERPAIDAPAPEPETTAPEKQQGAQQTHPRWPAEYDVAIIKTAGKYSRLANLSKVLGRNVNALLARWHQLRAS
jgi:hypothetical protein